MENLLACEIQITLWVQSLGGWLELPMHAFSWLGSEKAFLILMPTLYWCVSPTVGFRAGIMLLITNTFNTIFKISFHSPRPYWFDPQVSAFAHETSFGLPSGHSQTAASVWGLLSQSVRQRWLQIGLLATVFLIGLSRIYLGVHFTRDVLVGWLIGAILVWLFLRLEKPVTGWFNRVPLAWSWFILGGISLVMAGSIMGVSSLVQSRFTLPADWVQNVARVAPGSEIQPFGFDNGFTLAGTFFGMTSGYLWLIRNKRLFTVREASLFPLFCLITGILGVMILYVGLGEIFPRDANWISYIARYLRYTLIGLWVSAGAPLLFLRLGWVNLSKQQQ